VKSSWVVWIALLPIALGAVVALLLMGSRPAGGAVVGAGLVDDPSASVFLPLVHADYVPPLGRLCRFGVGGGQTIGLYDVNSLRLGWYLDWTATLSPASPGGIDYMPMVRLSQTGPYSSSYSHEPDTARILAIAEERRGATWLIGNEPDRRVYQDSLEPHVYATAYHDLYHLIKAADPSARIAAGGIVQPTPLRLQYLDMVLDSYSLSYGEMMPVDVWNIHAFILQEKAGEWGADIPPGIDVTEGELYTIDDNGSVEIFREGIVRFRDWMAAIGHRDRPLIVTEFGIQMPPDYGFPPERVGEYLRDTFDYLTTSSDGTTGYAVDGNRLVQKWAWYSLTDANFNGWLFDGTTRERTVHGDNYAAYTSALPATVNLTPLDLQVSQVYSEAGQVVSATLQAVVANTGSIASGPASVAFYLGSPPPVGQLIADTTVWSFPGCADTVVVKGDWMQASQGSHAIYVLVDSHGQVAEANEDDNTLSEVVSMPLAPAASTP